MRPCRVYQRWLTVGFITMSRRATTLVVSHRHCALYYTRVAMVVYLRNIATILGLPPEADKGELSVFGTRAAFLQGRAVVSHRLIARSIRSSGGRGNEKSDNIDIPYIVSRYVMPDKNRVASRATPTRNSQLATYLLHGTRQRIGLAARIVRQIEM